MESRSNDGRTEMKWPKLNIIDLVIIAAIGAILIATLLSVLNLKGIIGDPPGHNSYAEPCTIASGLAFGLTGFRYTSPETSHCWVCSSDAQMMTDSAMRVCGRIRKKGEVYTGRAGMGEK